MNDNFYKIKLGQGIGDIKFGLETDEVIALLGDPDEVEQDSFSSSDEDIAESWHYDEHEISLSFDEDAEWRLVTIAVSSSDFTLNDEKIIGESMYVIKKIIKDQKLGDTETEDFSDADTPNQKLLSVFKSSINFWFENDILTEVQFGLLWKDEENPIWP